MVQLVNKYKCWSHKLDSYDLEIEKDILAVCFDVPYKYKWVQLTDKLQNEVYNKQYTSHICKCKLDIYTPGKYYFNLYVSNDGQIFQSFIGGKQIELSLCDNKAWYFVIPIYTSWNRELLKNGKLKYVLCDTLLDNKHTMTRAVSKMTGHFETIREKVLFIHDLVANNLYYDFDALNRNEDTYRTIEQIISNKRCVCQGYADLALVLLRSIGLHAENILCYAIHNIFEGGWSIKTNRISQLNHIITRVKLEDRWLFMDITWDSNNKYEGGKYIKGEEASHRYFDVTLAFLSSTHRFFKADDI